MKAYHQDIGPDRDIPAPDVNTDGQIMAWMRDEYESIAGRQAPGVIAGKPPKLGGSEGRESATSLGGAVILDERGYDVVAVSNAEGAVYAQSGIDVQTLFENYEQASDIFEAGDERITNAELLTMDVDVLVPATIEDQITTGNTRDIEASAVLETANGPTTPTSPIRACPSSRTSSPTPAASWRRTSSGCRTRPTSTGARTESTRNWPPR